VSDAPPDREQRIAAYGLLLHGDEALLVQAGLDSDVPGRWFLPGGAVDHGEDPIATVQREFGEETGLSVVVGELVGVWSEMIEATSRNTEVHSVSIVYEIESWAGELSSRADERVAWKPIGEDDETRMAFVRAALQRDHTG
jgi:ADP-ribose pyrophosphatase YjhB (NUDIX family)